MNKMPLVVSFFGLLILFSCAKEEGGKTVPEDKLPVLSVEDAVVNRKTTAAFCRFYVELSNASDKQVTVQCFTEDGSAKATEDYISKSQTLVFNPGQTELTVDIEIVGDSLRQPDQVFYLKLSDPVNGKLGDAEAAGMIINNGTYLPTDDKGYRTPESYAGYHLVWHDEFNDKKLNETDWNYETGTGSNGWGNNELEYYTSRTQNVFLSAGNLVIEARKEQYNGSGYTSARITTQGKRAFTYGRIDIRAKLPVDKGLWPALWMLGNNISSAGWPACGEIDIMEVIGKFPSRVVGSLHWKGTNGESTFNNNYSLSSGDFSDRFHVFSLLWRQDSLQILVDDMPYAKAARSDLSGGIYPFDKPFFFIFNVAVGGNWPGPPDNTTDFPQRMFVDYVRVFQEN